MRTPMQGAVSWLASTRGYPSATVNVQHPFPNSHLYYLHSPTQPTWTRASYELLTSSSYLASCSITLFHHVLFTFQFFRRRSHLLPQNHSFYTLPLHRGINLYPCPPPPQLITAQIVQVVWAFQFIFNIVSFFCEGAVVLLIIFNWMMTWLVAWVTFLSDFHIYWHTGCKAIQVNLTKSNTTLPLVATRTSYAIQQVIYDPNST